MDPCRSVGDGGGASRRYLYTPVSITQADNECRLEGDKTHEIFHFLSKKVGGDISYVVPTKLKSGGDASPRPPPIYARGRTINADTGCLGCISSCDFHFELYFSVDALVANRISPLLVNMLSRTSNLVDVHVPTGSLQGYDA